MREAERARHERCPYCHDAFEETGEAADARVSCALCGAPHHAQCFLENRRCSVMGCGSAEVRAAGREGSLPVGVLEAEVEGRTLASPGGSFPLGTALAAAAIFALLAVRILVAGWVGAAALLVASALALVWLLLRFTPDLPEARVSPEGEPIAPVTNPVLGQAQGRWWGPDPFEHVKARIEAEAPPGPGDEAKPAPATPFSSCPVCKKDLEPAGEGEAVAFCYHCGAALS